MQIWERSSGLLALLFGARRGLLVDPLAAPAGSGGPGHSLLGVLLQVFSLPVSGNGSIGGAAGPPEGMGQEQARARGCRPALRQHGCPGDPSDVGVTQRRFSLPLGDIGTPHFGDIAIHRSRTTPSFSHGPHCGLFSPTALADVSGVYCKATVHSIPRSVFFFLSLVFHISPTLHGHVCPGSLGEWPELQLLSQPRFGGP